MTVGPAAAKTLSWHLASETTSTLKGASCGFVRLVLVFIFNRDFLTLYPIEFLESLKRLWWKLMFACIYSADDIKNSGRTSGAFNLLGMWRSYVPSFLTVHSLCCRIILFELYVWADGAEVGNRTKASPAWSKPPSVGPGSSIATHTLGVMRVMLNKSTVTYIC